MKMTQLLYFKTVAEAGKISAAAKKLYVTAPAVSIAIANLEKELGVELFTRCSNRVVLNEQGRTYLQYVNQIFDELDTAKKTVRGMQVNICDNFEESALTESDSFV